MSKFFNISTKILVFVFFGIVVATILFSYLVPPPKTEIQDNSSEYIIQNYTITASYNKDGTMDLTERITAKFLQYKHGIFRALPEVSKVVLKNDDGTDKLNKDFRLSYSIKSSNQPYDTFGEGDFLYVQFGREDVWYQPNTSEIYEFSYKITLDERFAEFDIFYFNLLGNLTDTTIANFSASVSFEEEIAFEPSIFVGQAGSTEELTNFVWNADNTKVSFEASSIGVGEAITMLLTLPENYSTVSPNYLFDYIALGFIIFTLILCFVIYFTKSNKSIITRVVQFSATKNYTPADIGYIIDKTVNTEDVASLIIYWAEKGYLNIIEDGKKTFLQKTDKDFKGKLYERGLFNAIFAGKTVDDKVDIKKIGFSISESVGVTKKSIAIENQHLFNKTAVVLRGVMAVMVAISLWLALILVNAQNVKDMMSLLCLFVLLGTLLFLFMLASFADKRYTQKKVHKTLNRLAYFMFLAGILIMCIVSYDPVCDPFFTTILAFALLVVASILILKMNVRSDEGCRELGDILGLKEFIEVAEKSRLEALVKDNPQMFYQILPYAYVLGVYDDWCKKFESIDIPAPTFYYGANIDIFDVMIISHILSHATESILHTINTANIAQTAESISNTLGGFGGGRGGGFSGGGLGGGGTGSW